MGAVVSAPQAGKSVTDTETSAQGRHRGQPGAGVAASDQSSFTDLHDLYFRRLVMYCVARTGDRAVSEEFAQEALLRLWQNLDALESGRPVWPWLKTVARNLTIDHHRAHWSDPIPMGQPGTDDWPEEPAPDAFEAVGQASQVRLALTAVPDRHAAALEMRYLEDRSTNEVAAFFGLSENTCKQLLWRARGSFRKSYQQLGAPS